MTELLATYLIFFGHPREQERTPLPPLGSVEVEITFHEFVNLNILWAFAYPAGIRSRGFKSIESK